MENLDDVDGMQGMESEEEEDVVEVEEPSSTDAPGQDGDDLQAADVPQAQSICNRLKWFFIRQTFKVMVEMFFPVNISMLQVFIQSVKALMIVAIVVLCYEAFMQVGWSFTWIEMSMN